MAGYIFNLNSTASLELYSNKGIYATKLSPPSRYWKTHHEGTFADYVTMKEGDNVYFFIQRKIYGIGKLINVGSECKYFNYPEAGLPNTYNYEEKKDLLLLDEAEYSIDQRFICTFKPEPFFFKKGVDMDDVLSSNPYAFKMLRAFWKLSFIKFDEEENQAFKDVILKNNQEAISNPQSNDNIFNSDYENEHSQLSEKLSSHNFFINISSILSSCSSGNKLGHEMALEVGLLSQLSNLDESTINIFDKWDYLSHQVVASPFKPIDYMDKMDIFGYSFIEGFKPTKSKFLVAELKKDNAQVENLEQLMKYVDWINNEYCYGDYSMIKAYLVAYDFPAEVIQEKRNIGIRKFTIGMKPARSSEWRDITLVKYSYNEDINKIEFEVIV